MIMLPRRACPSWLPPCMAALRAALRAAMQFQKRPNQPDGCRGPPVCSGLLGMGVGICNMAPHFHLASGHLDGLVVT